MGGRAGTVQARSIGGPEFSIAHVGWSLGRVQLRKLRERVIGMQPSGRKPEVIERELEYGPLAQQQSMEQRSGTPSVGCRELVTLGLGKRYTPFILPKGFENGQPLDWHALHFETTQLNLHGELHKMHTDGRSLVSSVWDLLYQLMGPAIFNRKGFFNVVPWADCHKADKGGRDLLKDVSGLQLARIAELQAEFLLSLGEPKLLTSCGGAAEAWFTMTGMADRFGMGPANMGCVRAAGRRPIAADLRASPGRHRPTVAGCLGRCAHPEYYLNQKYLPAEKHYKRLDVLIALHGGPPGAGRRLRDKMGPGYDVLLRKQQEGCVLGGAPTCLAPPP
jgi:hypothetical protein